MEEVPKDKKDLLTLSFVVVLIILAVIGCCLLFLTPTKKEAKKEEEVVKEPTNEEVSSEILDKLITITGIKDNGYINEILNSLADVNFNEVDDNTILNMFIYKTQKIEQVDSSYCNVGPNIETCNKYYKEDFISFLKDYDFINNFDYITNTNDEYIYLMKDVVTYTDWSHTYKATYGYNNDTSTDYITLEDNLYTSYVIMYEKYEQTKKYNYIFKKSIDDSKSDYYLIKVEKVD